MQLIFHKYLHWRTSTLPPFYRLLKNILCKEVSEREKNKHMLSHRPEKSNNERMMMMRCVRINFDFHFQAVHNNYNHHRAFWTLCIHLDSILLFESMKPHCTNLLSPISCITWPYCLWQMKCDFNRKMSNITDRSLSVWKHSGDFVDSEILEWRISGNDWRWWYMI